MADWQLTDLVKHIDQDKLVVPDFQRGFKWKSSDVKKLLESLLLDYPIGAALLWRTQRSSLEYRRIQDVEFSDDDNDEEAVSDGAIDESSDETDFILDGQQRITSIYKIFASTLAPTDAEIDSRLKGLRFYLDLKVLGLPLSLDDIDAADFSSFEDPDTLASAIVEKNHPQLRKELRRSTPATPVPQRLTDEHILQICSSHSWLPISRSLLENRLSHLHRLTRQASTKLYELAERASGGETLSSLKQRIDNALDRWTDWFTNAYVGTLNAKALTYLVLGNDRPEGLARIFETINSTGMSLSVFDLLVARLGAWEEDGRKVNLRGKVKDMVDADLLGGFDDAKALGGSATQQLPRALALRAKIELKKGEILRAPRDTFRPHLVGIGERVNRGLLTIREQMCVLDETWLPFKDLLTLSYACLEASDEPAQQQRKIALLWAACLLEDWDSQTNSKTPRWYAIVESGLQDSQVRAQMLERVNKEFPSFDDVMSAGSKSSGVFKTLMAFNLARGGTDWSGAERRSSTALEDHHLFPKDWINNNKASIPDRQTWVAMRDSVLNRVFVTRAANSSARAQVPPNYLGALTPEQRRTLQIPESFMGPLPTPIPYEQLLQYLKDRYMLMKEDFIRSLVEGISPALDVA